MLPKDTLLRTYLNFFRARDFRSLNSAVTWFCGLKKIVGSNNFSAQFIKVISQYEKMAITLMYCDRLLAWWSTQSWLAILLSSLLHAGGSNFRLYDGSDLKTYLLMRWQEPDALAVVRPNEVDLLDFFCSGIQFYILLSPIFALSPFIS